MVAERDRREAPGNRTRLTDQLVRPKYLGVAVPENPLGIVDAGGPHPDGVAGPASPRTVYEARTQARVCRDQNGIGGKGGTARAVTRDPLHYTVFTRGRKVPTIER